MMQFFLTVDIDVYCLGIFLKVFIFALNSFLVHSSLLLVFYTLSLLLFLRRVVTFPQCSGCCTGFWVTSSDTRSCPLMVYFSCQSSSSGACNQTYWLQIKSRSLSACKHFLGATGGSLKFALTLTSFLFVNRAVLMTNFNKINNRNKLKNESNE